MSNNEDEIFNSTSFASKHFSPFHHLYCLGPDIFRDFNTEVVLCMQFHTFHFKNIAFQVRNLKNMFPAVSYALSTDKLSCIIKNLLPVLMEYPS